MLIEKTEFARCENCKSINKVPIENENERNTFEQNDEIGNKVSYMVGNKLK